MKTLAPGYKRLQRIEESKLFSSEKTESQTWEANTLKKTFHGLQLHDSELQDRTGQAKTGHDRLVIRLLFFGAKVLKKFGLVQIIMP